MPPQDPAGRDRDAGASLVPFGRAPTPAAGSPAVDPTLQSGESYRPVERVRRPSNAPRRPSQPVLAISELARINMDVRLMRGAEATISAAFARSSARTLVLAACRDYAGVALALREAAEGRDLSVDPWLFDASSDEETLRPVCEALATSTASIVLAAPADAAPLIGAQRAARGGHHLQLVGVGEEIMRQSLGTSAEEIARRTGSVLAALREGLHLDARVTPRDDATFDLAPGGLVGAPTALTADGQLTLPSGEVFVSLADANGSLTIDGGVASEYGPARPRQLVAQFAGGRVVDIVGTGGAEIMHAIHAVDPARRVRALGFGVHPDVLTAIGQEAQDRVMPSMRLILGDIRLPVSRFGAGFYGGPSVELVCRRVDITVDGTPLLHRGRYRRGL